MYEDNYSGSPFEEHNAQNGTQSAQTQQETISQYGETHRESAHQYGTYDYQYANQNGAGSSASTGANKNARKKSSFGKTLAVILAVAIAAGGLCGAGVYGLSKYAETKVSRSADGKGMRYGRWIQYRNLNSRNSNNYWKEKQSSSAFYTLVMINIVSLLTGRDTCCAQKRWV